ncbi:Hypothetical predicted protein [Olea europaea subsp. europaea]|uniref:Uncharacterized protein n=1 Tax=Olea europaea subsp. europaea TaxID=158383 RepID=A0A8S0QIE4_OLEEU|nr:Hypothetical predicted protein [Olea europaea subsp. europaea]
MVLFNKHRSSHQSTARAPSLHHHHHHDHAPTPALTKDCTDLKVANGLRPYNVLEIGLHIVSQKLLRNAEKLGYIPTTAQTRPEHGCTPLPRNYLEMHEINENQVASLPYPGHCLHIVSEKLPRDVWKSSCIPAAPPLSSQDASQTWPTHRVPEIAQNAWEHACAPDMACTLCFLRLVENLFASLTWSGSIPNIAYTSSPQIFLKCLEIRLRLYRG